MADANNQRSAAPPDEVDWQVLATTRRSMQEYLEVLDDAARSETTDVPLTLVSKSDRAEQWRAAMNGHAYFAYATNSLIDLKRAVLVDVEASPVVRQAEIGDRPAKFMPGH